MRDPPGPDAGGPVGVDEDEERYFDDELIPGFISDELGQLDENLTLEQAKVMKVQAEAAKIRAGALKDRVFAIRSLVETSRQLKKLEPDLRAWVEKRLDKLDL